MQSGKGKYGKGKDKQGKNKGGKVRELTSDYDEWSATDASTIGPSASACVRGLESAQLPMDSWHMNISLNSPRAARCSDVAGWVFMDSGADEHVCPPNWAAHVETEKDRTETILRDVQGNKLQDQGRNIVRLTLGSENRDGGQLAVVNFIVGEITHHFSASGACCARAVAMVEIASSSTS